MPDPVTAPPAAPAAPTPPPAPSPEPKELINRLTGGHVPAEASPASPAPPASTPPPPEPPPAAPAATAAPAAQASGETPRAPDPEGGKKRRKAKGYESLQELKEKATEIATAAATAAVEATAAAPKSRDAIPVQFTDDELKELELCSVLEEEGMKPKGFTEKFASVVKELSAKKIAPGSDEEKEVFSKHGVEITEEELTEAERLSKIVEIKRENQSLYNKISDLEETLVGITASPKAIKSGAKAAEAVLGSIIPEIKGVKLFDADGGFVPEAVQQLQARPDGGVLLEAAAVANNFARAATLIFNKAIKEVKKDPVLSKVGPEVVKMAVAIEKEIARDEDFRDAISEVVGGEGKKFSPRPEWEKMSDKKKAEHWTITPEVVIHFATEKLVNEAKDISSKQVQATQSQEAAIRAKIEAEIMAKYGIQPPPGSQATPPPAPAVAAPALPAAPASGNAKPTAPPSSDAIIPPRQPDGAPAPGSYMSRMLGGARIHAG